MADNPWRALLEENAEVAKAFGDFLNTLTGQPALSEKAKHLIYIALQTANRNSAAVAAHIPMARQAGASRAEVVEAMLLTIPAAGIGGVMSCLPEVKRAFRGGGEPPRAE